MVMTGSIGSAGLRAFAGVSAGVSDGVSDVAGSLDGSSKVRVCQAESLKIGSDRSYAGILTWFGSSQRVENVSLGLEAGGLGQ